MEAANRAANDQAEERRKNLQAMGAVPMEYNLKPGETYRYSMVMESNVGGNTSKTESVSRWDVTSVSGDQIRLKYTTESNSMAMVQPFIKAFNGKSYEILMTRDGNILDILGLEAMMSEIEQEINAMSMEKYMKDAAITGMKAGFNKELLLSQYRQYFRYFPERMMKPGQVVHVESGPTGEMNGVPIGAENRDIEVMEIEGGTIKIQARDHLNKMVTDTVVDLGTGMVIESEGTMTQDWGTSVIKTVLVD